jgi:hypothetical protein
MSNLLSKYPHGHDMYIGYGDQDRRLLAESAIATTGRDRRDQGLATRTLALPRNGARTIARSLKLSVRFLHFCYKYGYESAISSVPDDADSYRAIIGPNYTR